MEHQQSVLNTIHNGLAQIDVEQEQQQGQTMARMEGTYATARTDEQATTAKAEYNTRKKW